MPKSLVVVESPAKAKTIKKFLGRDYVVKASMGHIRDLPKNGLAVDIEGDFHPEYTTIRGKGKIIKELQDAAKKVDSIYLAADPDREGEAICWHLSEVLHRTKKPIYRIVFNEITRQAIKEAASQPGQINQNLVDAQQARRVLDRLVGYQISPILWRNVQRGLSAGRVQSVAVRLICEREEAIEAFVPQEYWSVTANLQSREALPFDARLFRIGERKGEESSGYGFHIDEEEAQRITNEAQKHDFIVDNIDRKKRQRRPVPPFITSKLQQEAARKLRFSARKTMMIAQQLYEGLEIGEEGPVGLITYMRTDSTRVANEALTAVRSHIEDAYGQEYLPAQPVRYRAGKAAQDAHEAIRPTSLERPPESIRQHLNPDQLRLYDLIWKRFVASQMKPAVLDVTTVDIVAGPYLFRVTGSILKFPGFMSVYMEGQDEDKSEQDREISLPEMTVGEKLALLTLTPRQHFTQPPPRYTEATLVKELEEKGIGRPSTYATIISTIQDRGYVAQEQRRLTPTEIGTLVNKLLIESFPDILDVQFTAKMETQLDQIEEGNAHWVEVLKEFYGPFGKALEAAPDKIYDTKKSLEEVSDEKCEKCGSSMLIKWGRYGRFLACSAYPECKNTKPFGEKVPDQPTDEVCEQCGSPMVIRTARNGGQFLACSAYPECKNARPISTGVACPREGCDGYIGERRSRRGRVFYGCSNYPDCEFVSWGKPIDKACPQCDSPYLIEKNTKAKGPHLACPNKECQYTELLDS